MQGHSRYQGPLYPLSEHPGMSYPGRGSEIITRFSFAYEYTMAERQMPDPPRRGGGNRTPPRTVLPRPGTGRAYFPRGGRGRDVSRSSQSVARASTPEVGFDAIPTESLE